MIEFVVILKAEIQKGKSKLSQDLIEKNCERYKKANNWISRLISFCFLLVILCSVWWVHGNPQPVIDPRRKDRCEQPATIVIAYTAMLATQIAYFAFAYMTFSKFAQRCFKENLAGEKWRLLVVYLLILISSLLQLVFFFGEIT